MNTYYPSYYKDFICIADKCPITCCQEWKIAVDDTTYTHWCELKPPAHMHTEYQTLSDYTSFKDEQRVISLNSMKKCPFLQENKLCRLVLTYGDCVLSKTCTDFPREYHTFSYHIEGSLMPGCPAVLDLWQVHPLVQFPKVSFSSSVDDTEYMLFQIRDNMITLLQNEAYPPHLALMAGFYILLELSDQPVLSSALLKDYFSTETIAQLSAAISQTELSQEDMLYECNELLQDLAVNYQKEGLYADFLTPLLQLAAEISDGSCNYNLPEEWKTFHPEFKKYNPLIRAFLSNEFFSDLLLPEGDLSSMILHMQWIGMEYAAIRYAIFLSWLLSEEKTLDYETIRDAIVFLTRMTGYEDDDIYEYLENSFESLYWEWGYFAMILADI